MKILLLGEFSGFYSNLKKGFEELGHSVTLMSSGDGWKKIPGSDICFPSHSNNVIRRILLFLSLIFYSRKMKGYDVVLVINPGFFKPGLAKYLIKKIRENNKKIFLSACGDDFEYLNYGKNGGFKYWPYSENANSKSESCPCFSESVHELVASSVDGVIPVFYDYAEAWRKSKYSFKVKSTVGLPIHDFKATRLEHKSSDKLKIIHGLNRPYFKGGDFIEKALMKISEKYPNDVEVNVFEPVSFNEYRRILDDADIVVDQCKFHSAPAMNALYSMSRGKVVFAGQSQESLREYEIESSPIIHIEPDVQQIVEQLENVIKNRSEISKMSKRTFDFVEKNHTSRVIASKYIEIFNS